MRPLFKLSPLVLFRGVFFKTSLDSRLCHGSAWIFPRTWIRDVTDESFVDLSPSGIQPIINVFTDNQRSTHVLLHIYFFIKYVKIKYTILHEKINRSWGLMSLGQLLNGDRRKLLLIDLLL